MEPYGWSEANGHAPHSVKYESEAAVSSFPYCTETSLNFSTSTTAYSEDDAEYATGRRNKTSRQDPLSHRIIEKRRRDRMNSCLADLSRLIPSHYQRKGRGRIEKTEIIEMAIRHLKHLQTECIQKDNDYRLGYMDCMKEAAKFLYDSQMQEFCYRLVARLQDHCDELMKNDCFKTRGCHAPDNVSASSGSPHQAYHPVPPLCQLRDMLGSSDIEHSNDHNDVKDLSFRNHLNHLQRTNQNGLLTDNHNNNNQNVINNNNNKNNNNNNGNINNSNVNNNGIINSTPSSSAIASNSNPTSSTTLTKIGSSISNLSQQHQHPQPHQAPVITSTASTSLHHHTDSSNHDFDSSREPLLHTDTSNMHSPPPRDSLIHLHNSHLHNAHLNHSQHTSDSIMSGRLRNFSESSHDIEHNNNYKYKNHIKERFNHELHDEETSSEHCPAPPLLQSEHSHTHSLSEHSKDGTEPEIAPIIAKKRKLAEAAASNINGNIPLDDNDTRSLPPTRTPISTTTTSLLAREDKPFAFSDIKTEMSNSNSSSILQQKALLSAPSSTTNIPAPPPAHSVRSFAVPIFALHGQGTYYVPLNIDYNVLLPFLNGIDLLEKNYTSMPVVHPININVNFMPPSPPTSLLAAAVAAASVAAGKQQPPPMALNNGNSTTAAVLAKAKLETITNGW